MFLDIIDFDDLCTLSLCKIDYFPLQIVAISTLIELYPKSNLALLLQLTDFFQYIIAYLWEYLSDNYSREYNSKASSLLLQLHSILPDNLCEEMILNQLSLGDVRLSQNELRTIEDYKRFFKLWNFTREISTKTKTFQYCLIAVLSILKRTDQDCMKSMIEEWINQCFVQGKTKNENRTSLERVLQFR